MKMHGFKGYLNVNYLTRFIGEWIKICSHFVFYVQNDLTRTISIASGWKRIHSSCTKLSNPWTMWCIQTRILFELRHPVFENQFYTDWEKLSLANTSWKTLGWGVTSKTSPGHSLQCNPGLFFCKSHNHIPAYRQVLQRDALKYSAKVGNYMRFPSLQQYLKIFFLSVTTWE